MAKKSTKNKGPSLRQRLRDDASKRLAEITHEVATVVDASLKKQKTGIDWQEVLKMLCSNQTKTVRTKLIGQLADEAELELEKIYNNELDLLAEKKNDSE